MSTIPLTLIEGAMALPRTHPLERLPRSFGREWALLPPNVSFRAELKALYAAMLHTFCLSADAIRSACRWEPLKAKRTGPVTASHVAGPSGSPAAPARAAHIDLRIPPVAPPTSTRKRMALGGACAVSGAAILAWIALSSSHSPPDAGGRDADNVARADAPASPRVPSAQDALRNEDARLPAGSRAPGRGQTAETVMKSASAATTTAVAASAGRDSTRRSTRKRSTQIAHANVKSSRKSARDATGTTYAKSLKADQRRAAQLAGVSRRSAASNVATATTGQRIGTARRPDAALSAAGRFSPHAASTASTDDYASIKTWAATLTGSPATSRTPVRTNNASGDWMNGMTQRRVTEVPDSFSP
ncbi:hypothetical protein [Paraburkholderia gardini]|uniref:hypothetical protein n=1 Tax=Paraburkholderia gardini TaxID=2823469 RepID=UPI001D2E4F3D|nr:hypothetical protein [Paraburkholderia gardini]CAG4905311.1 hypothetical protein R69919_03272 [Paraburkholderia gardini]